MNKFQLLSIAVGLALALPLQAGQRNFGGGGGGGGGFHSSGSSSSHSAPSRNFSGRMAPGRNFSGRTASMTGPRFANGHFNSGGARVLARQPANAHPNWSHNHDHFWHGHHCRFVNGSWVLFDFGFYDPFFWGYPYGYPYAYGYPYGYPYGYGGYDDQSDNGVYDGRDPGYQGSDARSYEGQSPVAVAQARLKRLGYYHGRIDGKIGPATERAIAAYQRDHGQHVTGSVTPNALNSIQGQE